MLRGSYMEVSLGKKLQSEVVASVHAEGMKPRGRGKVEGGWDQLTE